MSEQSKYDIYKSLQLDFDLTCVHCFKTQNSDNTCKHPDSVGCVIKVGEDSIFVNKHERREQSFQIHFSSWPVSGVIDCIFALVRK